MYLIKPFFVSLLLTICVLSSHAQGKFSLAAGLGLPELANVAIRYEIKQSQLGLSLGAAPWAEEKSLAFSGDWYLHFGGSSQVSDRKPWYFRATFTYYKEESDFYLTKSNFLTGRIGKDVNFTKQVGLTWDAGLLFRISENSVKKQPSGGFFGTDGIDVLGPVVPSVSLGLFVKL